MENLLVDNQPNAGKLVMSLRSSGYDNISAIADIIDNSIDANAHNIKIRIDKNSRDDFEIIIADDGDGMDKQTLDEALKLGSLTERDHTSDLGRYGMGLCTASLSLCKRVEILTRKKNGVVYYSCQDIDEVTAKNKFVKELSEASESQIKIFEAYLTSDSGTIVFLKKIDRMQNKDLKILSDTLKKELGQVYRDFIFVGKKIFINRDEIKVVDPLMRNNSETKIYSDEVYDIYIPEKKMNEKIRVIIALLPVFSDGLAKQYKINQINQGFYVMRNHREIASGKTMNVFTKHNDLNRLRMELSFSGSIDDEMGVNFAKQDVKPEQFILDRIKEEIGGQINSIRASFIRERGKVEGGNIDHSDAEKVIAQKSKLLITPEATVEKRSERTSTGSEKKETSSESTGRDNLKKVHTSPHGLGCRFELVEQGVSGPIYECYQEGKIVVIQYNIEHPFYQKMLLEMRDNKNIINAVDYFVYAMASAELKVINDDNTEILNNVKSIISTNLRTLLS